MKKIIITIAIIIVIAVFLLLINISKKNNTFTNTTNFEAAATETTEIKEEKYLSGSYEWVATTITTNCVFFFTPDGKVLRYNDAISKGTYDIEGDQVLISYYEIISPGGYLIDTAGKDTILDIINDDTLFDSTYGDYFKKVSEEDIILLKQQKEMEQLGE